MGSRLKMRLEKSWQNKNKKSKLGKNEWKIEMFLLNENDKSDNKSWMSCVMSLATKSIRMISNLQRKLLKRKKKWPKLSKLKGNSKSKSKLKNMRLNKRLKKLEKVKLIKVTFHTLCEK